MIVYPDQCQAAIFNGKNLARNSRTNLHPCFHHDFALASTQIVMLVPGAITLHGIPVPSPRMGCLPVCRARRRRISIYVYRSYIRQRIYTHIMVLSTVEVDFLTLGKTN